MNLAIWIPFIGTVLILTLTPGPSVLLATSHSMKYGVKKTAGTIFGDLSTNPLQIILASSGLATIVVSSGEIFQFIKWFGVLYLIYLGIRNIFTTPKISFNKGGFSKKNSFKLYTEGFLMSAANPKAIIFFAALFPLFISEHHPFLPQVIILAITFLVLDGLSLALYAHFATRLKGYLEDREKVHLQNKLVGTLLILSGLMLSLVKRSSN